MFHLAMKNINKETIMKVLTLNADNRALYLLNDEDNLEVTTDYVVIENNKIYGLNSNNTAVYYEVEDPLLVFAESVSEDSTVIDYSFAHSKFLYDGQSWSLNPNWIDESQAT